MKVLVINNDGGGFADYVDVPEGTTVRDMFQRELSKSGYGKITSEIIPAGEFYYAEDYHQQYLAKNPGGYCGLGGTGVSCPQAIHN